MANKAIKYRIYPTTEQSIMFAKTFGCCRKVYNLMLTDKIAYYKATGKSIQTTPAQYKDEYPYLREVDSLALANVQLNLQAAYKNFFDRKRKVKSGFPKFKSRKARNSYTTNNQRGTVSIIDDKYIKIPKIGKVKAVIHRKADADWKIKSATISKERDGSYYISILYEFEKVVTKVAKSNNAIGLDYASNGLFVDSNGKRGTSRRFYHEAEYYLTNREIDLLKRLDKDSRISDSSELFEVNIGLVSGKNEFFIMNKSRVVELGLEKSVTPIISQSKQVKGINLTDEDYKNLAELDKDVFFFAPENKDFDDLLDGEKLYIQLGEKKGFNTNYKCSIRPRWYYVPQSWHAEAFMLCNADSYPRMILNKREMLVTNNLHKIRFLEGIDGSLVTAAFLNAYTLAISELIGRGYSSGLLLLTPSLVRRLRIPMRLAERLDFQKIDDWQRKGEIDKILEYTDSVLLREGLGLTDDEIRMLHDIWDKLRNRRLNRNKK